MNGVPQADQKTDSIGADPIKAVPVPTKAGSRSLFKLPEAFVRRLRTDQSAQKPTPKTALKSTRRVRRKMTAAPVQYAHITGWGMKIPDRVVTNVDLEAILETSDEWIRSRTGIQERRIAGEREGVVEMGFEAARAALNKADLQPYEIDLIIVATSTPEDIYPSTACRIQTRLGADYAGAFDLSAACSGFVYALNMAAQSIRSGSIDNALVIGTEVNSRVMDWTDRSTSILFGDGAGAVVLTGNDTPGGLLSCVLGADGSGAGLLGIPQTGRASALKEGEQFGKVHMDGREVFRFATHIINESIRDAVAEANLDLSDVALIVPHQANQRILSAAARSLNVPESLFYSNVHKYGNTSAASIPIALCEAEKEGRLKPNDNLVLVGFGGGLTWATAVIQWQTIPVKVRKGVAYRVGQGQRELSYIWANVRAFVMRVYRRIEAQIKGSPVKPTPKPAARTTVNMPKTVKPAPMKPPKVPDRAVVSDTNNADRVSYRNKASTPATPVADAPIIVPKSKPVEPKIVPVSAPVVAKEPSMLNGNGVYPNGVNGANGHSSNGNGAHLNGSTNGSAESTPREQIVKQEQQ